MTKGLKVWLWLVLVVNAVFCLGSVAMAFLVPSAWVSVLLEVLIIAGTGMLLFARRKAGFYLICGSEALSLVVNIIQGSNVISSVISAVIMPMIIWLLMKNTWYEFR